MNGGKDDWCVFLFMADKFEGELIDSPKGVIGNGSRMKNLQK